MNRFALPLFCLLVSIVIWIQVASTTILIETVALPLRTTGLAPGLTVAGSELPATVTARLQGSKLQLLSHRLFHRPFGSVTLDLSREQAGAKVELDITPADVRSDFSVVAVTPPISLRLTVDRLQTRRLPVTVAVTGEPPPDRALLRPPRAEPESVAVAGPARLLRGCAAVLTEPVDLGRLRAGGEQTRRLVPPREGLAPTVPEVRVVVALAARERRTLANVRVVARGGSPREALAVVPLLATLVVSGPADSLRELDPARVWVEVDAAGLAGGARELRGQAVLPRWCRLESLAPDRFLVRQAGGRRD